MLRGVALAESLQALFPPLDASDRRLSLAIYGRLADGRPVDLSGLCREMDLDVEEMARRVYAWPGVYRNGERRIIGFWGLTLHPMRHRLRVNERELFAWCAWDTLFIPELLGASADVASACQGSGAPVRLHVSPNGVVRAEPEGLHISFVVPEDKAVRADVITAFCHYVHFFSSKQAAAPWLDEHVGAFLVPLSEAFELGRLFNHGRYG